MSRSFWCQRAVWCKPLVWARGWVGVALVSAAPSCQRSVEVARVGDQLPNDSGAMDGSEDGDSAVGAACVVRACRGKVMACGNCVDDDADGLVDALDPDCWGECDDSEVVWGGLLCNNQSCFFDRDCGLGNDQGCASLTPNGCDCHGCCEIEGRDEPVFLGTRQQTQQPTCSSSVALEPSLCASCVLDEQCFNPCDSGEPCFNQ